MIVCNNKAAYRAIMNGQDAQMIYRNNNIVWNNFVQKVGPWDRITGYASEGMNTDNSSYYQGGWFAYDIYDYDEENDDFYGWVSTPVNGIGDSYLSCGIDRFFQKEGDSFIYPHDTGVFSWNNVVMPNGAITNVNLVNMINGYIYPIPSWLEECTFDNGVSRYVSVDSSEIHIEYYFPNFYNTYNCNGQTWYDLTKRFDYPEQSTYELQWASIPGGRFPVGQNFHYTGNLNYRGKYADQQNYIFISPPVYNGYLDLTGVYGNTIYGKGFVYNSTKFNSSVWLSDNVTEIDLENSNIALVEQCSTFNNRIYFGNNFNAFRRGSLVRSCVNYNRNFIEDIPANCHSFTGVQYCQGFAYPLNFSETNVYELDVLAPGCTRLNKQLDLGRIHTINNGLQGCVTFNSKVYAPYLNNCGHMFESCSNYNYPVNFETEIGHMAGDRVYVNMFRGCSKFNQPIDITTGGRLLNGNGFLDVCSNFNSPVSVILGENADVTYFLRQSYNFNQPVYFGLDYASNIKMSSAFLMCRNFNSQIVVRPDIIDATAAFYMCNNLRQTPLREIRRTSYSEPNISSMYSYCQRLGYERPNPVGVLDTGGWRFTNTRNASGVLRDCVNVFYYLNHIRVSTSVGSIQSNVTLRNIIVNFVTGNNSGQWVNTSNCNVRIGPYNSDHFYMNLFISAAGAKLTGLPQGWLNKYISYLNDVQSDYYRVYLY